MSRQLVRGAIAAVVVISATIGLGMWYEPADPISQADEFDRQSPSGPVEVSGTVHLSNQRVYSFSLQQDEAARLTRVSVPNVSLGTYQHRSSNRRSLLVEAESDRDLDQSVEQYADDPDESVIQWNNDSRQAVIVDRRIGPDPGPRPPSLVHDLIAIPRYEPAGTTTVMETGVTIYRPTNGWYDEPGRFLTDDTVRVSGVSGVMLVDHSTDRLVYSNVSYLAIPSSTID